MLKVIKYWLKPLHWKLRYVVAWNLVANVEAAAVVGKRIAEKAKAVGVEKVAFDRSGFQYHGRVKALAEAARWKWFKLLIIGDFQMAKHEIEERGDGLIEKMVAVNRVN